MRPTSLLGTRLPSERERQDAKLSYKEPNMQGDMGSNREIQEPPSRQPECSYHVERQTGPRGTDDIQRVFFISRETEVTAVHYHPPESHSIVNYPQASEVELRAQTTFAQLLKDTPIPHEALPSNLALYQRRETLASTLVMHDIYKRIQDVPGVLMEFGTLWGRRLALLIALRELYEPYDYTRRVIGFDSFSGFPDTHANDGRYEEIFSGSMATAANYEQHLTQILRAHEAESYHANIQRFELIRGDVRETLPRYLEDYPETIVSLAYFDLDLYEPTRACLQAIRPRLVKGSILAFDQLVHRNYPGETIALLEGLELMPSEVQKLPYSRSPTLVVI